jgi:hypothetical protein
LSSTKTKIPNNGVIAQLLKDRADSIVKIDIGGGACPQAGWINMDVRPLPAVHVVHDWDDIPWPSPDACASIIMAGHVVEHVNPAKFGFIRWMDECWRILKYDGQLLISTPFGGSMGYLSDPTHCNPCTNHTWRWFDPLDPAGLFREYFPKPWKIQNLYWSVEGNMECLLIKRHDDPSYYK